MNISSDELTMSSVQNLRELINERLTAAAEEIFTEFEKTIVQYEEEIDRQRRLLDNIWKPEIKLHTTELPQQHICKEEEVPAEQNVCIQERNFIVDQEDPEPLQIKEEEIELFFSPDLQQQHIYKEQEVFTDHLYCKQEKNFCLNQKDPDPPQITGSQDKFCISLDQDNLKPPQIEEEQKKLCISLDQDDQQPAQMKDEEEELCISLDPDNLEPPHIKEEQEELCTNLDPEDTEPPQMREEEEELYNSWGRQQSGQTAAADIIRTTDSFMLVQCKSKCEKLPREKVTVSEDTIGQDEKEIDRRCGLLNITQNLQIKLHRIDLQQQHIYTGKEVFTDHLYCKRERNFCLDQKDPEPPQITGAQKKLCISPGQDDQQPATIKEEEEELCISLDSDNLEPPQIKEEQDLCNSREGEQLDTIMWIFTSEVNNDTDPKPISGQLLFHKSILTGSPDQEGSKHPNSGSTNTLVMKTHDRNSSHNKNVDSSSMSQIHCDADTRNKRPTCDICGIMTHYKYQLKRHYRVHTGEKPFSCETCGKSYTVRRNLNIHMRTHTHEKLKLYRCKVCRKRFYDLAAIQMHRAIHKDHNLYPCKICEKGFTSHWGLKVHMRVHTGEMPYSCNTCDKSFRYRRSLLGHMGVHTDEKPNLCNTGENI